MVQLSPSGDCGVPLRGLRLAASPQEVSMAGTTTDHVASCLTRTCLKWTSDGELTASDLHLVLERLAAVDARAEVLRSKQAQRGGSLAA